MPAHIPDVELADVKHRLYVFKVNVMALKGYPLVHEQRYPECTEQQSSWKPLHVPP